MSEGEVEVTLKQLLDEIQNTKKELKNYISASEARLLLEIQELKNRNCTLERENRALRERLEKTERWCNKKNIVIFGLKASPDLTAGFLCQEIHRLLGVRIELPEISDYYTLGNRQNSPVKVEFVSYRSKKLILEQVKKLKGTEISIANDLTVQQRQDNKKLIPYLVKARTSTSEKTYIRNSKLVVGRSVYTLEDLENSEGEIKTSSAPNTPQVAKHLHVANEEESGTVVLESEPGPSRPLEIESYTAASEQLISSRDKKTIYATFTNTQKNLHE